jgi:cellulose synthase/poly-beta-1,6-N-acetylglucosamine synthase-like glycosyltransferase
MSLLWVLLPLLALFDLQNALAYWRRGVLVPTDETTDDYTVVVPLYGHPRYLQNLDFLKRIKPNVVIAIDTGSRAIRPFALRLARDGWRVHTVQLGDNVGPDSILQATLASNAVKTTWVVRMDADTWTDDDLGRAVAVAKRHGAHMCSVKCHVAPPKNVCEQLQFTEYAMAMRTRHYRAWMTSGACILGTTHAYRTVLERHSLNFATCGGDIETGQIARNLRMKVKHVDFIVYTEVPSTWRSLTRQRLLWWGSSFRTIVCNFDSALRMPGYLFYYLGLVWIGLYWKVQGDVHVERIAYYLPTLMVAYSGVCLVTNWPVRSKWMILFPYYSLAQVMVMPLAGSVWFIQYAIRKRKNPRFRFSFCRGRYAAPPPVEVLRQPA